MIKRELLVIDPQRDFCDPTIGKLYVEGAKEDTERLVAMFRRLKSTWHDVHITLDTHHLVDIAHPIFWLNSEGKQPNPFTIITVDDVENGVWRPFNPAWLAHVKEYVRKLAEGGRYPLCIWPPHCLIGTAGWTVMPNLMEVLLEWEADKNFVDFVTKGSNMRVEHYSAVKAEVEDPSDPTTMLNMRLIQTLQEADVIALSGQALSHCVANTVRDIANNFGEENIKKLVLITDTTSPVTGFENLADDFVKEMVSRGMQTAKSTEFGA